MRTHVGQGDRDGPDGIHPHRRSTGPPQSLWSLPVPQLLAALGSREGGLTEAEAAAKLEEAGHNEPAPAGRARPWAALRAFLANPLMIVLLVAGLASAFLGQRVDAGIIISMVLLGGTINFVQTFRSQRAVDRLRAGLAPMATVVREGRPRERLRREIVPGDIVELTAGDLVPGDARLLAARDLHINEAALTGESLPVEKELGEVKTDRLTNEPSVVLFGTSVVSGSGTAVVVRTGRRTVFGGIAQSLAKRPPETEFERGARAFGALIMKTVVALVLFVVVVSLAAGRPPFESVLFAVALAVGLTPEFLPMISTVTLAQGAVRMAREKVIVKNLASIQNFGSIDILCSDKTGTLTSGQMVLDRHLDASGAVSERVFLLAYLNCLHETGLDSGVRAAVMHVGTRSPLDTAILGHDHPDITGYAKLDEVPYDFERRRMSVVVQYGMGRLLITKGAPEGVLALCTSLEERGTAVPMSPQARSGAEGLYERLSNDGFRVLAVAYRSVQAQPSYGAAEEHDLTLAGLLAFMDRPLPGTAAVLASLRQDGVEVKILSGDNERVARHVCAEVGIEAPRIILGEELNRISDAALMKVAEEATVFARVSPAQKNRILLALKARGHIVGFMGDGINDAPSLHAADVGISVAGAVDVAKDAAEIILVEGNLSVLHRGIIEGRKAFANVVKYLLMGTSSNFGNMFSMAGAFLFLPFLPMLPTQILLNNFLYDLAQVTIPTDNVDPSFVQKPRRWDISLIRNFMLSIGPVSSVYDFLTFFVLLKVFHATEALFHTGWFVESLATQTLVIFVIRTEGNPLKNRASLPLTITTLAVVTVGLLLPASPFAGPLGFVRLPAAFYGFLVVATGTYLLLVALVRHILLHRAVAHPRR